jgi:endonuclease YncB( thermonuclease family)
MSNRLLFFLAIGTESDQSRQGDKLERLRMTRAAGCILAFCACLPAQAAEPVDESYIRSLAAPGKTVLVIEYYDGQGEIAERKGFASASGFRAISATDFRVDSNLTLHLYGIEPCEGDMVNRKEGFAGSCNDYARQNLETLLQSPRVIYCRAFVSEQNSPTQNATCYGYYNYPGSLDSVDMLEDELVSLGALRVSKKPDGSPERSDLNEAQRIGKQGYGMWADPRVKGQ